jgi:hypothetical protein
MQVNFPCNCSGFPFTSLDREPVAILRSPDKRLGQVGNTCGKWDNGFYTRGFIQDIPLDVLIDNGSTTTILSNHMVKLPLVPGLLSNWVPEVSLDRCVLSARCVSVLILFLCSTTGPLLINLLFTFDEDRTISTNVTNLRDHHHKTVDTKWNNIQIQQ